MLSLSEAHASLYVASPADGLLMYVQEEEAKVIAAISLSDATVKEWLAKLDELTQTLAKTPVP